jgi:hypothetical protein
VQRFTWSYGVSAPEVQEKTLCTVITTVLLGLLVVNVAGQPSAHTPIIQAVDTGHGITLHYVAAGTGKFAGSQAFPP